MTYQVLARKYRPSNFQEVAGQEHVLRALINALDQERLHHAYLFTGTRGTGKTTLARILAKCLNCETGITSKPCGTCGACQEIAQGRFIDLLEIDAASRTKVEDTRELLENVQYAPTRGRYKVYLIDEVHMLSGHSFNALLKTLEEPPPHVKFLLATTDPQRLPVTVLSRCLQFNLKNLTPERITQQLDYVLKQENIKFETNALPHIARAGNGSLRDALSLLDQAIAYGGGEVKEQDIRVMLGSIEQTHLLELVTALATHDAKKVLSTINMLAEHGADFSNALEELLSVLHRLALAQTIPDVLTADESAIAELAKQITPEDVQLFYQIGLIGRRDLPLAPAPQSGFEMILLRMLAFRPSDTETIAEVKPRGGAEAGPLAANTSAGVLKRQDPEAINKKESVSSPPSPVASRHPLPEGEGTNKNNTNSEKRDMSSLNWPELIPQLNLTGFAQMLAMHCTIKEYKNNHLQLALDATQVALLNPKQEVRIAQALTDYFKQPFTLQINVATTNLETPARQQSAQQAQQQKAATQSLEKDSNIQTLMKVFDATIQPGSIQATPPEPITET
jgi:DNA polymerase-3 subunit gamma/tau